MAARSAALAHGAPILTLSVDADDRVVADLTVEEGDEGSGFLGGAVDAHGPHALRAGAGEQFGEVGRACCPVPLAPGVGLACQPVVGVAPAAAGHSQHAGAHVDQLLVKRGIGQLSGGDPGRSVGAQQPMIERDRGAGHIDDDGAVGGAAGDRGRPCVVVGRAGGDRDDRDHTCAEYGSPASGRSSSHGGRCYRSGSAVARRWPQAPLAGSATAQRARRDDRACASRTDAMNSEANRFERDV